MSNYGVGGGPFPDLWLVDGLGIFSRGWIHQKYNEKRNRISKRELWQFQKSYQKSMSHRWWLNEFILDSDNVNCGIQSYKGSKFEICGVANWKLCQLLETL